MILSFLSGGFYDIITRNMLFVKWFWKTISIWLHNWQKSKILLDKSRCVLYNEIKETF